MKLVLLSIPTLLAGSLSACAVSPSDTAASASEWRDAMVTNPITDDGCYHAAYPGDDLGADRMHHGTEPPVRVARRGERVPFVVGNGADFALQVSGLIHKASGSFLPVTDVTSEKDGTENTYSLQLNSNFMAGTAACNGIAGCQSWAQFVYSTSETSAFIQNWLIGIGTCPSSSFISDGQGDCFINSAAVTVPALAVTDLASFKMSGAAVKGGNDTLTFAVGTKAFTTHEKDTVTDLASAWNASEFNIIGDGGATEAVFNKGASGRGADRGPRWLDDRPQVRRERRHHG